MGKESRNAAPGASGVPLASPHARVEHSKETRGIFGRFPAAPLSPRTVDVYEPSAQDWERDLRDLRVRLLGALGFMVAVTLMGTVGFKIIDPSAGWVRAFFMTAITLTTVGYGHEVQLETDGARIFTAILILVGMGGVLYFVSTTTAFVLEGHLGHVFRRRRMEKELARMSGHLIVCGSGSTALYTAKELTSVRRPVVLVVERSTDATRAQHELPDVPVVVGDPAHDDILVMAGIQRASGLVACTDSDKENLVVTLTARQLNPKIRIVTRVMDVQAEAKLRKVGADAVVSPNFIGGLRLASELIRPTVVTFLDTMLRDRDLNLRIDEIRLPAGSPAIGRPLNQIGLEKVPNALLLAIRGADGVWQYNPPRSGAVAEDMVLIFLGSPEDSRALCAQLQGVMIAQPT
jgi:voltage-gated potassium channel